MTELQSYSQGLVTLHKACHSYCQRKRQKEAIECKECAIRAVLACDITQDPPIAEGDGQPYDVVMSMLCFENGCLT